MAQLLDVELLIEKALRVVVEGTVLVVELDVVVGCADKKGMRHSTFESFEREFTCLPLATLLGSEVFPAVIAGNRNVADNLKITLLSLQQIRIMIV